MDIKELHRLGQGEILNAKNRCIELHRYCSHIKRKFKNPRRYKRSELKETRLHHVNFDPTSNPEDGSNHILYCLPCHDSLHGRGNWKAIRDLTTEKRYREGGRVKELNRVGDSEIVSSNITTYEAATAQKAREPFTVFLLKLLNENDGEVVLEDYIGAVCKELKIGDTTARKYLKQETNRYTGQFITVLIDNTKLIRGKNGECK